MKSYCFITINLDNKVHNSVGKCVRCSFAHVTFLPFYPFYQQSFYWSRPALLQPPLTHLKCFLSLFSPSLMAAHPSLFFFSQQKQFVKSTQYNLNFHFVIVSKRTGSWKDVLVQIVNCCCSALWIFCWFIKNCSWKPEKMNEQAYWAQPTTLIWNESTREM